LIAIILVILKNEYSCVAVITIVYCLIIKNYMKYVEFCMKLIISYKTQNVIRASKKSWHSVKHQVKYVDDFVDSLKCQLLSESKITDSQ